MLWLPGHFCQDLGVLRETLRSSATELGGSVPFPSSHRAKTQTKLSDFRTFHSGKNNCTLGNTQTLSKPSLAVFPQCAKSFWN